jgi:hypothetical protein
VVFVIRKSLEGVFKEEIFNKLAGHVPVAYVFQELAYLPEGFSVPEGRVKPWGTGQAVLLAGAKVDEPFAVINGDDFYGPSRFASWPNPEAQHRPRRHRLRRGGYRLRNTLSDVWHGGPGRVRGGRGRLAAGHEGNHQHPKGTARASGTATRRATRCR